MKGPGFRVTLDVRRLWVCPQCGRRLRMPGRIVARRCFCERDGVFMTLTEERLAAPSVPATNQPPEPAQVDAAPEATETPDTPATVTESPIAAPPTQPAPGDATETPPAPESAKRPAGETAPGRSPRKKRHRKRRRKGQGKNEPGGPKTD